MGPIEIVVIVLAVSVVAGFFLTRLIKKKKGIKTGGCDGCCDCCSSCPSCKPTQKN